MTSDLSYSYTCFDGHRHLGSDSLPVIALVAKRAIQDGATGPILIFDDTTGRSIDLDTRGSDAEIVSRLSKTNRDDLPAALPLRSLRPDFDSDSKVVSDEPRGRGRPKLGVVAREVTLLPRHWEWLATQPGGASVAIRKLVEDARRNSGGGNKVRMAIECAYNFMSAMAGNFPGFEEATRALFARDSRRFGELIAPWPADVRAHVSRLAQCDQWTAKS